MRPSVSLPLPKGSSDETKFRDELLEFASSHRLWQILCGGVHMLDFLVRDPDLYATVLPGDWREWLQNVDVLDLIDLLNGDDIEDMKIQSSGSAAMNDQLQDSDATSPREQKWKSYALPPSSLVSYISKVRSFLLDRTFHEASGRPCGSMIKPLSRRLATGMNHKKLHEVENFSAFVNDMCQEIASSTSYSISDIVDFGAGQGYLGRSLASPLYKRDIVSVESKPHNITGAKRNDALARISKHEVIFRNKKLYRASADQQEIEKIEQVYAHTAAAEMGTVPPTLNEDAPSRGYDCGTIRHIEHRITSGDLSPVIEQLEYAKATAVFDEAGMLAERAGPEKEQEEPRLMVISLHSCGNLLHHGLRSLVLNDAVKAVAMVGCCYNLCTERLGGPTFKLPNLRLRTQNKRLLETSNACDEDGFPMSDHFASYRYAGGTGVKLNITARMMAVQAPRNWTREHCDNFFTRHWYRAILQRLLMDNGIVQPVVCHDATDRTSADDMGGVTQPITIGRLSKTAFVSLSAYVREALGKLSDEEARGEMFGRLNETLTDEEIESYERRFAHRRHELCILWTFMAFSAGVVETLLVVDRWQWLREQDEVADAWVQTTFDYSLSPRNLVVVGVKH